MKGAKGVVDAFGQQIQMVSREEVDCSHCGRRIAASRYYTAVYLCSQLWVVPEVARKHSRVVTGMHHIWKNALARAEMQVEQPADDTPNVY